MPLVKRAKALDVETLYLLDDEDAKLIAAAPAFQDCPFAKLDQQVLATDRAVE